LSETPKPSETSGWRSKKNIGWVAILAVFIIAAILISIGLRGNSTPTDSTSGYIDPQEIEELIEVEDSGDINISAELLAAGYKVPIHGPFCDDKGNVFKEWERIYVESDISFLAQLSRNAMESPTATPRLPFYIDSYAPLWLINSSSVRITKTLTPIINIATLTLDGKVNGVEVTEVVDLTNYTDPATNVIFVEGCNLLPGEFFSRTFDVDGPAFLHRINANGTVNIAEPFGQSSWMTDEEQIVEYHAVSVDTDAISDQFPTQQFSIYSHEPYLSNKISQTYQYSSTDKGIQIFRGDDREPLVVRFITAPPANHYLDEYERYLTDVPTSEGLDPIELYENGFCFGTPVTNLVITRTQNPDSVLLPEGVNANWYITDSTYTPQGPNTEIIGPCSWLLAKVVDQ
jgi:hypothetical protein